MAKLTALPSATLIDSMAGVVDYYYWRGIPVARKWPRSPGRTRNDMVMFTSSQFLYINQEAHHMHPDVVAAYQELAQGTAFSWKDFATRLFMTADKDMVDIENQELA